MFLSYAADKQTNKQTNRRTRNPTHADRHSWRGNKGILCHVTWQDGRVRTAVTGAVPNVRRSVYHVSLPSSQSARLSRCPRSSSSSTARGPRTSNSCRSAGTAVSLGTRCYRRRDTGNLCVVVRQRQRSFCQSVSILFSFDTNIIHSFISLYNGSKKSVSYTHLTLPTIYSV